MSTPVEKLHPVDAAELRLKQAVRQFTSNVMSDADLQELREAGRAYGRVWLEYVRGRVWLEYVREDGSPAAVEVIE